jgi:PAS domain S-box-containing protein
MSKAERIMQIAVEKTVEKQRKPEEKGSCDRLLRHAAENKLVRSSGTSSEMKAGTLEGVNHELQVHQIELEMQNEELRKAQLNLEKSRQRYADLYDFAPVGYFTFTPEALIKEANLTGATLLEMDRQRIINGRFRRFVASSDFDQWDQHFLRVLREGEKQTCDLTLKRQDGSTFQAGLESIRIEVSRGEFEVHTTVTDITKRKRAEEELLESEKRYRELYDFLPTPVYEMDFEANITSVNRAVYETFGGTEEDLKKGFKAWQLLSPEETERSIKNIQRLIKGEQLKGAEYTLRRLDGSVFPAIVISSVIYRDDKPVGLRGVIVDITERKRAEEEQKESKALIEAVVENVPLMIFLKEATDLRFVIFNRAGEELLGYARRDLIGKNNLDLFPPEQAAHFMAKDREVLDGEAGMLDIPEEPIQTARKGQRVLHTRKVCIRGSDGVTKFLLGISEDITERKRAEEQLQYTLKSLRKAFGSIIQVLVSAVETKDPYTAGHQNRSADLARAIATEMGFSQEKIEGIRMAGSIHDIGKLSIPAEILSKPTKLSNLEFSLIKEHPQKGYDILKNVESPWPLAEIVYQHHERLNGSGYPRGLKGEDISQGARILMVADVVEAMASNRPYRPALGIEAALEEIEKSKGVLYDSRVAEVCLKLFREKGFGFK